MDERPGLLIKRNTGGPATGDGVALTSMAHPHRPMNRKQRRAARKKLRRMKKEFVVDIESRDLHSITDVFRSAFVKVWMDENTASLRGRRNKTLDTYVRGC